MDSFVWRVHIIDKLISLALIGIFVAGIIVTAKRRLRTSKRHHIVGRSARLVGFGLLVFPLAAFIALVLLAAKSLRLGNSIIYTNTFVNVAAVGLLSLFTILFVTIVWRLSVPIASYECEVDACHSNLASASEQEKAIRNRHEANPYAPPVMIESTNI